MFETQPALDWIDSQVPQMRNLLRLWCDWNSGTFNIPGLTRLGRAIFEEFRPLAAEGESRAIGPCHVINSRGDWESLFLGNSLVFRQRPQARRRVLLSIHFDTVYPLESPFQRVRESGAHCWTGPGVADAKGGLVVLLFALRAYERFVAQSPSEAVGWDVVLNSDEEIGSPGSRVLFEEAAPHVSCGLLFEPALPDGHLISSRKGSGNFSFIVEGQAAHAGRDFAAGRNAIVAAGAVSLDVYQLNGSWPDVTLNVARIDGGAAWNMVPDRGVVRVNVRYRQPEHASEVLQALRDVAAVERGAGISVSLSGDFSSPPKLLDFPTTQLLEQFRDCGQQLGLDLRWNPSGGTCDGNRLAALGVPNVDSLGVRGGNIHSHEEFVELDSLPERAKLTALWLMRLSRGEISGLSEPHAGA